MGRKHTIEGVVITADESTSAEYIFRSGIAMIGATSTDGLVDAIVDIKEVESNTSVAATRTYTSDSNNPRQFILNPGTYQVTLTALGALSGKEETFSITVVEGSSTEIITTF